jgi:hypothetical protein
MTRRDRVATAICAGVLAIGLAGCTGVGGTPAAEPDPSPTAATATPSATPAPVTPTPVAAEPASCDSVLSDAGYADLAGWSLFAREFAPQSWDYPLLHTMSSDGVVCLWGNSPDFLTFVAAFQS